MKKTHIPCAVVWLLLCWPALGMSQTQTPHNLLVNPKLTSEYVKYEGTLICFRCDVMRTQESKARCEQEGHASLLKRTEGRTHRLYGSKHSITEKLSSEELHGKQVKIEGIYDTETNWLLVEKVDLVER